MISERGAVAITVALLMVSLVGFTAIAVDVGALWMDRKELQNGADAAALALAQSCAEGACEADEPGMASSYATGNKRDDNVTVTGITHGSSSVTVDVASERNHWFAPIIGHDSLEVTASATASWGGIGAGLVSPFTVSICHLADVTGGTSVKMIIKGDKVDCVAGNPPHTVPGGMNWLDTAGSADCTVMTSVDGWAPGNAGNDGPNNSNCNSLLTNMVGEEILIPLFDEAKGTGGGSYHIVGFAVLLVSDYCLNKGFGWYGGADKCTGAERSVTGTFVKRVNLASEVGGPNYGATAVQLTQ
ncbi:pilus assembly protein TadG-related protein [Tessaracoccus sp. O5.2]|uniref:pilus assembly protein TadG-related protein n=1 Tax=Tessaracoccus sp. O5.2 TaxID=3157622 RepID=UPI0036DC4010